MGQSTIRRSGIYLIVLCSACHGFPVLEDLSVVGNGLDDRFPSLHVVSNDALLQSKYNLPVIVMSPPTNEFQRPLVQELLPPMHSFQMLPITELRPPTAEYQPPVVKFNWKKRVEVFPDPSSPLKVPMGSKGTTSKVVTPKTGGVGAASSSSAWWASVPVVDRHLQPPTENFYFSG